MFTIKNLSKNYVSKSVVSRALQDISFKLPDVGMCFIVGKSGSGKSTLLNLLTGMDKQSEGTIKVSDQIITDFSQKKLDDYRNGMIGYIFQEFNLLEDLNVLQNIILPLELQKQKPNMVVVENLLKQIGLDLSFSTRKINQLSGGQKQRIAIARALIKNPKIIIADEPTGNLDSQTTTQVFDLLKELAQNKLIIVVSHDMESAYKYADRIISLKDGKIESDLQRLPENKISKKDKSIFKEGQVVTAVMMKAYQEQLQKNPLEENFILTDESQLLPTKIPFTSFSSRLSFKFTFKTALQSFKSKKFFLFLATLVTAIVAMFLSFSGFRNLILTFKGIIPKLEQIKNNIPDDSSWIPLKGQIENKLWMNKLFNNPTFWLLLFVVPGLLIMLYFSISAKFQNRKMGILRALGANSFTISKIFIFEIFIFVILQTLLVFFMYFLVVFFIFPTFTFDLSPILFQTFEMREISNFSSWEKIVFNIDNFTKVVFDEMLDPQKNSEITNISRWLMFPQLSFHPFVRNLLMNLFIFVYIFIISVSFTSFIIYKWSFKKPVDIINDK